MALNGEIEKGEETSSQQPGRKKVETRRRHFSPTNGPLCYGTRSTQSEREDVKCGDKKPTGNAEKSMDSARGSEHSVY